MITGGINKWGYWKSGSFDYKYNEVLKENTKLNDSAIWSGLKPSQVPGIGGMLVLL
ncbi:MAG TPA: hypothetical protein ACHBX0_14525 [Arsenophonus sp.]